MSERETINDMADAIINLESENATLKAALEASQKAHFERVKIAAKYREALENVLEYSNDPQVVMETKKALKETE